QSVVVEALFSDGTVQVLEAEPLELGDPEVVRLLDARTIQGIRPGTTSVLVRRDGVTASLPVQVVEAELQGLEIRGPDTSVPAGHTTQFRAFALYSDGTEIDVSEAATWSIIDPQLAVVSNGQDGGLVAARQVGHTFVRAQFLEQDAAVGFEITAAVLESLSLESIESLFINFETTVVATGTFSDGSQRRLVDLAWTSSNEAVVEVNSYGLLRARGAGSARIRARSVEGPEAELEVTVVDDTLVELTILGSHSRTVYQGQIVNFEAQGRFASGQVRDLTQLVQWWSSNQTRLPYRAPGTFEAVHTGASTVLALASGLEDSVAVEVDAAVLVELVVTGGGPSVPTGVPQQYYVEGVYSDGSRRAIQASWRWSGGVYQDWELTQGTPAILTPLRAGEYDLEAYVAGTTVVSPPLHVSVSDVGLQSIEIDRAPLVLPRGVEHQFEATGVYDGGLRYPLLNQVNWSLEGDPIGTLSPSTGRLRNLQVGAATVTATHKHVALSGSGEVTVEVSPATQVEILDPDPIRLRVGDRYTPRIRVVFQNGYETVENALNLLSYSSNPSSVVAARSNGSMTAQGAGHGTFRASHRDGPSDEIQVVVDEALPTVLSILPESLQLPTGLYYQLQCTADSEDVTSTVIWSSSQPGAVSVSPQGLLHLMAPGRAVITARHELSGLEAAINIEVVDKQLENLEFDEGPTYLQRGDRRTLEVIGITTDGSRYDVSRGLQWSSSNTGVATVGNDPANKGKLTLANVGTVGITVEETSSGLTQTLPLEVVTSAVVAQRNCTLPRRVKLSRDGTRLFILNREVLQIFRTDDLSLEHSLPFVSATDVAESFDGLVLFVGQSNSPDVTVIDLMDFSTHTFTVPGIFNVQSMEVIDPDYLYLGVNSG
ncbi:MAG: hypothetical protein KC910_26785, partial [Candidatus Eremiobacteraeota bacterium]|nr:hypothetical protein [Candidatus Eremiobacteraeota bacterium]